MNQHEQDALHLDLAFAEEQYYEIKGQYECEVALYGDAWPGAQDLLSRVWQSVIDLRRKLNLPDRRVNRVTPDGQPYWTWERSDDAPASADDDIDF